MYDMIKCLSYSIRRRRRRWRGETSYQDRHAIRRLVVGMHLVLDGLRQDAVSPSDQPLEQNSGHHQSAISDQIRRRVQRQFDGSHEKMLESRAEESTLRRWVVGAPLFEKLNPRVPAQCMPDQMKSAERKLLRFAPYAKLDNRLLLVDDILYVYLGWQSQCGRFCNWCIILLASYLY